MNWNFIGRGNRARVGWLVTYGAFSIAEESKQDPVDECVENRG
jgi:hypothetical protein